MSTGSYLDWNQRKIKAIVEHYGHQYFVHKKVLDLGCEHGDLGGVLHRLGSDVTAVDARQEHLKVVSKKYAGVKVVKADLDGPWPFFGKTFDLILDLGLLCHINNFEAHLEAACLSSTYLVLETAVADSNDPNYIHVQDDAKSADGSYNGVSTQVSAACIERILQNCGMTFKRMDSSKLNCGKFVYDWLPVNNKSFNINKRRLWFCVNNLHQIQGISIAQPAPIPVTPAITINTIGGAPGVYSSHLIDSKIPVTHQRVMTTKSPTPPSVETYRSFTVAAPVAKPKGGRSVMGDARTRVFFNYYEDPNPARQKEIDLCLEKNLDNPLFDLILIDAEKNPTFDLFFDKINLLALDNDISIICNSDIFFDDSIRQAAKIGHKQLYALAPWNYVRDNYALFSNTNSKQDAWIVRGRVDGVNGDFPIGMPGSDARLAYEFQAAGYTIINPSRSIKPYHVHLSGVRRYTEKDRILGQYLLVEPTALV
jgi:SAM-dependent methyltransferase